ncbi:hypothetical protein [Paractinoplanes atraurantiacus]|uniref:Secreted protein n=1 Tax=Paractinoplanes atraurantiacus TaxID=1036182 RepID=A0A285II74_9ACTN|nr:hypothetical protein [Actinoplanes atraurantiacus]SNY47613.1 hypothetical protein SAMN05421748_108174 [Actinoplanes atraurantiacus]
MSRPKWYAMLAAAPAAAALLFSASPASASPASTTPAKQYVVIEDPGCYCATPGVLNLREGPFRRSR